MDSSKDSADEGYVICSSVTDIKAHEKEKYEDENPGNVYMELGTPDYEKIQDSAVILKPHKTDKGYMMPVEIHDPGYSKLNIYSSDSPYELPVHVVRPFQNETSSKKTLTDTSFQKSESKPPLPERYKVKSKRSKRPFLIGCVIFILTIITCALVVVLYIIKKDTPEGKADSQNPSTGNTTLDTTTMPRTSKTTASTTTGPITTSRTTSISKVTTITTTSTTTSTLGPDKSTVDKYKDCKELHQQGFTTNGVYTIYPYLPVTKPVKVYCDMTTDGGGWTVFQHRKDGSVDFYLDWVDYKSGFGQVKGEHWLGNDHLHQLTMLGTSDFYVRLERFIGGWYYAKYNDFLISNETGGYRLRLQSGSYQGNAGDSMETHQQTTNTNGYKFSTRDVDHDSAQSSCAVARKGAWWHNECTWANLNGMYGNGICVLLGNCNFWYSLTTSFSGVKTSFMMVRRV